MATGGDILPTDGGLEGKYLALESVIHLTLGLDAAFLRLDHSIAELCGLSKSIYPDNSNLHVTAERYASFYENAERIIVRLLKFVGIEVDAQRTSPFQHCYHENVLQTLADEGNVFYHILGRDDVQDSLRRAKMFRNKHRRNASGANELHSVDGPRIATRTKIIAQAILETGAFSRRSFEDDYINSILEQLLETRTQEIRQPLQDVELSSRVRAEVLLGSTECESNKVQQGRLLEASYSHLCILTETFMDVSSILEQVPENGQAQEQLLNRFVSARLEGRRQKAEDGLDIRMGELSARAVDLIRARTHKVVELESRTMVLQFKAKKFQACFDLKLKETEEIRRQLTHLEQESEASLQQTTERHDGAVSRSNELLDENVSLRNQLAAERETLQKCKAHKMNLEARNERLTESRSHERLRAERASEYARNHAGERDELLDERREMQQELRNLKIDLREEHSSRKAAEAKVRWLEDKMDSMQARRESLRFTMIGSDLRGAAQSFDSRHRSPRRAAW